MMTTEGSMNPMNAAIDNLGVNMQPKYTNALYQSVFFCFFMVIGSIFLLNLFVGVVIDNFNKIKDREEVGGIYVTDNQRRWIEVQHLMVRMNLVKRLYPPKN